VIADGAIISRGFGTMLVLIAPIVVVVGVDELLARRVGGDAGAVGAYHEIVNGRRFRISAPSFFQIRPDGADVLAGLVAVAASGCNTVRGIGKDIEKGGEAIQKSTQ
jgi:entericidin B